MELLFVAMGGFLVGALARYTMPHRNLTGAFLIPMLSTAFICVIWEICTWLRMPYDQPWIWVIAFGLTFIKAYGFTWWITRRRLKRDNTRAMA